MEYFRGDVFVDVGATGGRFRGGVVCVCVSFFVVDDQGGEEGRHRGLFGCREFASSRPRNLSSRPLELHHILIGADGGESMGNRATTGPSSR